MRFFSLVGCVSILLMAKAPAQGEVSSYVEKEEQGWLWYRQEVKGETNALIINQSKEFDNPLQKIKEIRKEFKEVLATALLNPTLKNVTQAKQKQLELEERATEFAKMWQLSHVIESAGYSQKGNPHPWHQEITQQQQTENLKQQLKQLSKTYGLFFAFKKSCPYCHRFAPVVVAFAKTYGFELRGISADGDSIEEIANVSKDNGALSVINPDGIYPALFLANPKTMEVVPIAWGMVTTEQLLQNLEVVLPHVVLPQVVPPVALPHVGGAT